MTDRLPRDLALEVRRTLADLRVTQLAATAWPVVAGDLGRLSRAVDQADAELVAKALVPISQATFEGKVLGRLAGSDRAAAYVAATKQTSALPWVGAICGVILVSVGHLLGGWAVALGAGVFALFIFGVAYAGTHTNRERVERRHDLALAPTKERTEPAPTVVLQAVDQIEAALDPTPG